MPGCFHVIRFQVVPGRRDDFVAALAPMLNQVNSEAGTLLAVLTLSRDEPDVAWYVEAYRDEAARDAHSISPVHARVLAEMEPLLADGTVMHDLDLVWAKGLTP